MRKFRIVFAITGNKKYTLLDADIEVYNLGLLSEERLTLMATNDESPKSPGIYKAVLRRLSPDKYLLEDICLYASAYRIDPDIRRLVFLGGNGFSNGVEEEGLFEVVYNNGAKNFNKLSDAVKFFDTLLVSKSLWRKTSETTLIKEYVLPENPLYITNIRVSIKVSYVTYHNTALGISEKIRNHIKEYLGAFEVKISYKERYILMYTVVGDFEMSSKDVYYMFKDNCEVGDMIEDWLIIAE